MKISCLTVTQEARWPRLQRAARCFARQTYADREWVIVHDGGDALDARIRAEWSGPLGAALVVHSAAPGQSLGALRNLAVSLCSGTLVCQWDDDDLSHPGRLAAQQAHLLEQGADFSFFSDELHYFEPEGEFYWDDWNRESWPLCLIQGTLLGYRAKMPAYPALPRGEDTGLLLDLHRQGARLAALKGKGFLHIYVYHGGNAWEFEHHAAISGLKRLRKNQLLAREAELRDALRGYEWPPPPYVFPHDGGELVIAR